MSASRAGLAPSGALIRCRFDPRFSYALAVPAVLPARGLLVTVHNSVRWYRQCMEGFCAFAERRGLAVLAPLFPPDLFGEDNPDGYKCLLERDVRYDLVLEAMVGEVAKDLGGAPDRFLLHGYSGGAQFVHRYLFVHPQRVVAAAIGAPGAVTLLDGDVDWWAGVRDLPERFGSSIDLRALRQVPIQLVVGDGDTEVAPLREQPPSRFWRSDAERLGANRIDRLRALQRSLTAVQVETEFELMPGISHGEGDGLSIRLAERLFGQVLGSPG
ncbi:MAG TPA: alpha/beta hydrolase [Ideonella sp.]|nr:alpha/beta hydrolase [Ideonella sp.]